LMPRRWRQRSATPATPRRCRWKKLATLTRCSEAGLTSAARLVEHDGLTATDGRFWLRFR
jgi:hypothetical protein